jgi:hypothetical protein
MIFLFLNQSFLATLRSIPLQVQDCDLPIRLSKKMSLEGFVVFVVLEVAGL